MYVCLHLQPLAARTAEHIHKVTTADQTQKQINVYSSGHDPQQYLGVTLDHTVTSGTLDMYCC